MKYPDIFNPDLSRIGRRDSQTYNVVAGILVTDVIKTSLGPRGMEKVYIDILGEATVTKHGGAFLRKLDVDHPAAKAVVDAVNTVDTHVGDGTISAAVLMGAMLRQSKELLGRGFPTAVITRGFEEGMKYALEALDEIRIEADAGDRAMMRGLAVSCLEGKALFDALPDGRMADVFIDAVCQVADLERGTVNTDDIKIEEKPGDPADIRLVGGTVIDKPADNPEMPRTVGNVKVLLLNDPLETTRTRAESEIEITSPEQMGRFASQEDLDVLATVKKVVDSGAGLVVSRKGISGLAQERLAREGIMSVRRAKYNDLWWLEKSTGARVCRSVEGISGGELGFAGRVHEESVGGDRMVFVESEDPGSVTILLRAGSKRHLDEFHRTALNAICVLRNFIESPFIVYGGGSCEAIMAKKIRERAPCLEGKEQVVVERFADALEEIPMTLARNLGMSALDALPAMRSMYAVAGNGCWYGVNAGTRELDDMAGTVVEPLAVKQQVVKTAVEAINMILNVDDVFVKDLIDNTHCHIDGTVHAHKEPGRNHNHWEQEGLEQRQMHHYY